MIKSVRKNKTTGKWEFDYKDLRGKRKIKKGFKTKVEAEKAQAKIYEDLNKGLNPTDTKITLKEAGDLFMRLHASINCKPSTITTNQGYLDNHINPFFGDIKLSEVTTLLALKFREALLSKKLSNNSVNKIMVFLSSIFNFMINSEMASKNPLAKIKPLKVTKNKKIRTLSTIEVQALLTKTKVVYPDFYPLLFTAIFTGMRQGELMALTWDSINWIKQKITIDKNYTHGILGTPKSGKIRVIDMSEELVRVLKQWRLACPHSELNLVFPNTGGKYQSAENMMKRRFYPSLNRAGIDAIRFHDLRHTYASLLIANGAPMKYVQHQLGHSSITMTMDLYTHLLPEVNDKCVNLLNSIVNQAIEPQEEVRRFGT